MDKEKLEKGKEDHIKKFGQYWTTIFDVSDAFKQGAEWLMQQPLSERLTEEEREKIRSLYDEYHAHIFHIELEGIFGKDLFNDK